MKTSLLKLTLHGLMVISMVPTVGHAQASLDEDVNAELDKMYQQSQLPAAPQSASNGNGAQVQVNVQAQPQATANSGALQTQSQAQIQKQPVTYVEASPLMESRAEKLRKARQDAEVSTEQTLVEKLEQSRLEDEKRRADALFGDKLNNMNAAPQVQPAVVVPVAPAPVVVAPAPVVDSTPKIDREEVRGEINAAIAELKSEKKQTAEKKYFSGAAGVAEYPTASNVRGQYALGFSVGKKYEDRLMLEGSFLYSNYQLEQVGVGAGGVVYNGVYYPRITEIDQYNAAVAAKYQLLDTTIRPVVGAVASYTYRNYTDTQFAASSDSSTSHAFDMGLIAGADLEVSESMSLGLEYRYMYNITSRANNGFQQSFLYNYLNGGTPLEKMSYYTLTLVGRATF